MATSQPPNEPPPSYEAATGSSSTPTQGIHRVSTDGPAARTERNGIPPERRRSMEDEMRELPPGWVRSFDPQTEHQFFVDTRANPPRSTWLHPYDDDEFLNTLSPEERNKHTRIRRTMTLEDLAAEDSDDKGHARLPPRPTAAAAGSSTEPQPTGLHKFSRKLKDKVTGQTHTEREQARAQRAEQERQAYLAHLRARQALMKAIETGQPQFLCKDQRGRDIYIEPPHGPYAPRGAYGYNPYGPPSRYQNPNARYMRPAGPYARPYGYGYGGGAGLPIAAGFLGGALLGGALF
ncbi:Nn.00g112180.m01.CDS01 [Neocucurbitaria sp. VM-36]